VAFAHAALKFGGLEKYLFRLAWTRGWVSGWIEFGSPEDGFLVYTDGGSIRRS
jgi:hypothetical protein